MEEGEMIEWCMLKHTLLENKENTLEISFEDGVSLLEA